MGIIPIMGIYSQINTINPTKPNQCQLSIILIKNKLCKTESRIHFIQLNLQCFSIN